MLTCPQLIDFVGTDHLRVFVIHVYLSFPYVFPICSRDSEAKTGPGFLFSLRGFRAYSLELLTMSINP